LFKEHLMASMACPSHDVTDLVPLMRAEYLEMPGMRLTLAQAARLWNTDTVLCARALQNLVEIGFLCHIDDRYVRVDGGRRYA
jgi:hypothetical protein